VALLVLAVVIRTARAFPAGAGKWLAGTPAFLVLGQVILGILVVQNQKPPTLTTLHVVMGAGLLASLTALAAFAAQSEAPGRRAS
jgi:fluoride ion exporter CrcB/FEX